MRTHTSGHLETTATIVRIAVALPAIAGLFFPGIGIQHHPPARAAMGVRELQARITRGEFIEHAIPRAERPPPLKNAFDRREVGKGSAPAAATVVQLPL